VSPHGAAGSEIVERIRRLEGGGLRTFVEDEPLVWERAEGAYVEDADGRRYVDLYGGYAVATTGYGHPAVVEAIHRQAAELIHCPSAHPSRVRAEFLEAIATIAPPRLDGILPAVTGAMANELALAVARTRRPDGDVITFGGSYFGRGAGVVGLAGKARYREALALPATGRSVPFPGPLASEGDATDATLRELDGIAGAGSPISAVICEPILGNGGVVIPPDDFLPRLRTFCDRTGALLIVDEIQSGFGRTGRMWAVDHVGVVPDLLTIGKGIGGGMGVAAVLGRADLLTWPPDTYTSTFLTNAVTLAAATASIGVLHDERLVERSAKLGGSALDDLRSRLGRLDGVVDVRGRGLWIGIELPDGETAARVARRVKDEGVIVGRGGMRGQVIKLSPPLVIDESDLEHGVDVVSGSIEQILGAA
jgi:4-aminobutyrate aminotransferase-like enzyme